MLTQDSPKPLKNAPRTSKSPPRAPRADPQEIKSPIWTPFRHQNPQKRRKSAEQACFFADPLFSAIFGPIRGLPGQGPHAIYTRRRDRNTFHHFSSRPSKKRPNDLQKPPFWEALGDKIAKNAHFEDVQKDVQKKTPQSENS